MSFLLDPDCDDDEVATLHGSLGRFIVKTGGGEVLKCAWSV